MAFRICSPRSVICRGRHHIVYTTHDVDLACAWSDSVAVFHEGVVIGGGQARDVLVDGDLLRRAHLRLPLVLDVGLAVKDLGLVTEDAPLPRSRGELLALFGELEQARRPTRRRVNARK